MIVMLKIGEGRNVFFEEVKCAIPSALNYCKKHFQKFPRRNFDDVRRECGVRSLSWKPIKMNLNCSSTHLKAISDDSREF